MRNNIYIEDEYTELKIELIKDIKKEIIAFANTKGGKIYIGIDDDGSVIGLNNAKGDLESLSGMIREEIKSDLTLYNVNYVKNHEKILPSNLTQEEKIIEYLNKNNKINRNIVEQLLDILSTRAKNILNNMCKNKLIVMVGSGKKYYIYIRFVNKVVDIYIVSTRGEYVRTLNIFSVSNMTDFCLYKSFLQIF